MSNAEVDKVKADLTAIAHDSIAAYKRANRNESKKYLQKVKRFADTADALTRDMVFGELTQKQYLDGLDNIKLSMDSYLIAQGYKQSRRHLAILIKVLKRVARVAAFFLSSVMR